MYVFRVSFPVEFSINKMKRQDLLESSERNMNSGLLELRRSSFQALFYKHRATSGIHGSLGTLITSFKYQLKSLWNSKVLPLTEYQTTPLHIMPYPKVSYPL